MATLRLAIDPTGMESGARRGESALDRVAGKSRQVERGMDSIGRSAQKMGRLVTVALGTMAGIGIVQIGRNVLGMADAWERMSNMAGTAIRDMDGAGAAMKRLTGIARSSYSSMQQTVETFSLAVPVFRNMGKSADEAADYVESLNLMLVAGYVEGQRAESVQRALNKAMAVGTLQADGLQSVLSNSAEVSEALASELGVTTNQLYEMSKQGKITGDVISSAITSRLEETRDVVAEMPYTLGGAMQTLRTELQIFAGGVNSAAGATSKLAEVIVKIAENLDRMAAYVSAAVIGFGVRYVGALAAATMATATLTGALVALRGALIRTGIGALVVLAGELALQFVKMKSAADDFAAALGDVESAQDTLETATARYYENMSRANLIAIKDQASLVVSIKKTALAKAEAELAAASFYTNFFGASLYETERMATARAAIEELKGGIIEAEARLSAADHAAENMNYTLDESDDKGETLSRTISGISFDNALAGAGFLANDLGVNIELAEKLNATLNKGAGIGGGGKGKPKLGYNLPGAGSPLIGPGDVGNANLGYGNLDRPSETRFEVPDYSPIIEGLSGVSGAAGGAAAAVSDFSSEIERLELDADPVRKYNEEIMRLVHLLDAGLSEEGFQHAVGRAADELARLNREAEESKGPLDDFESGARSAFTSFITGANSAREALSNLLNSFANVFANRAFDSLWSMIPFADGGVFQGGSQVKAFANGGVVGGPTFFPMSGGKTGLMGEAGPEAIMPLKRGPDGKLGVQAEGGGGPNITFAPNIDARGADVGAVARIEQAMAKANAEFESRAINAINMGKKRRMVT